jgi:hypothetical protein
MGYEIEDLFVELLDASLVTPRFRGQRLSPYYERATRVARRATGGRLAPPGRAAIAVDDFGPVDFAYFHAQFPRDLAVLEATKDWRRYVGKAVCFIEEAWVSDVEAMSGFGQWLEQFDAVFVGIAESASKWSERLDVPVTYLPYSVDALTFAPRTPDHSRGIDVINIGRRSPVTHQALVDWSRETGRFYYFDSFRPLEVKDAFEHRLMLSMLMGNARLAITNRGIGADPSRTRQQHALPARYFEAAAAGAVLVGARPDVAEFDEHFDWSDAIIDLAYDEPEAGELIETLLGQSARLDTAGRRNVAECLFRHDHLYRLDTITTAVGVDVAEPTRKRRDVLADTAKVFSA